MEVYRAGAKARRMGHGLLSCPHARHTEQWNVWRRGWLDADIDYHIEGLSLGQSRVLLDRVRRRE